MAQVDSKEEEKTGCRKSRLTVPELADHVRWEMKTSESVNFKTCDAPLYRTTNFSLFMHDDYSM